MTCNDVSCVLKRGHRPYIHFSPAQVSVCHKHKLISSHLGIEALQLACTQYRYLRILENIEVFGDKEQ